MGLLLDSFWRAAAYCMHPRVMALSVLPLLILVAMALGLGYFYWDPAIAQTRALLDSVGWLQGFWSWLQSLGFGDVAGVVAPLLVILLATPLLVIVSLLVVALVMTPALVDLVGQRRFPELVRHRGGSMAGSVMWSLVSTVLALVVLVVSVPLWFIPPLVLVLPPLIWGWLTYRVMAFDALSEHASKQERQQIFKEHRSRLLVMGVLSGYLGAAPSVVWASGVVFAAAFFVLVPLAIWIYTLVFAFSSLWFSHYCLAALAQLRAQSPQARSTGGPGGAQTVVDVEPGTAAKAPGAPITLAPAAPPSPVVSTPGASES